MLVMWLSSIFNQTAAVNQSQGYQRRLFKFIRMFLNMFSLPDCLYMHHDEGGGLSHLQFCHFHFGLHCSTIFIYL